MLISSVFSLLMPHHLLGTFQNNYFIGTDSTFIARLNGLGNRWFTRIRQMLSFRYALINKEGILLGVSTSDNGVKTLANPDGIRLLRTMENQPFDASRVASASVVKTPMMSMFGAANTSMGQSIMDRVAPMPSIVVMNCDNRS